MSDQRELAEAKAMAASVADGSWHLLPRGNAIGRPCVDAWAVLAIAITAAMLDMSLRQATSRYTKRDLDGPVPGSNAVRRMVTSDAWATLLAATFYESMSMVDSEAAADASLGIHAQPGLAADRLAAVLRPSAEQIVHALRAKTSSGERAEITLIATGRNLRVWDRAQGHYPWPLPTIRHTEPAPPEPAPQFLLL